jgi:outer membrane protein
MPVSPNARVRYKGMEMTRNFLIALSLASVLLISNSAFADAPPKTFGLADLYRMTVDGAETVRAKVEEHTQVQETKNQGTGALLPTITGIGTYYRAGQPSVVGSGYTGDTQKTAKLTGTEHLFHGGSEYAYLDETNRLLEGKQAEVYGARIQYFIDLSNAYYNVLLNQALLAHAKKELELYENQIGELRTWVRIGKSRSSDLLTVQAAHAGSLARLQVALSAVDQAKLALVDVSNLPVTYDLQAATAAMPPLDSLEHYLQAASNHPDLIAQRKRRDASESAISYQRGFHLPDLDLNGNYYLEKQGYTNDSKWDATLTLTIPIFAGGATQSLVRQAASVYRENEVSTGLLERKYEIQIRTLHQTLTMAVAELQAFSEAVDLARKSYDAVHRDYQLGRVTNFDLINSMQTLTAAERSYDQSRYQHLLERARLDAGAGRLPN